MEQKILLKRMPEFQVLRVFLVECPLQGTSKITFPGSVDMMWNNCVCLPTAGRKTQLFYIIFTEPGKGF